MDKKFKKVFYAAILLLIPVIIFYFMFQSTADRKLNLGEMTVGDDTIKFQNSTVASGHDAGFWSEDDFLILSETEYQQKYPDGEGLGIELALPPDAVNVEHFYQFTPSTAEEDSSLHDEVYLWEMPYSGTSDEGVIYTNRTTGNVMLLNDRSYVQVVLTKDMHPLTVDRIKNFGGIPFSSTVNGKAVAVGEKELGINGQMEAGYEAVIKNIDGKNTNCYITADGMSREYLIYLLQTVCGEDIDPPKLHTIEKDRAVLDKAKEKIAIESTAKSIIQSSMKRELDGKITDITFVNEPFYHGEIKSYNDKKYNVTTDYILHVVEENGEEQTIEAKRWMLIEKNAKGVYREKGKPLAAYKELQ